MTLNTIRAGRTPITGTLIAIGTSIALPVLAVAQETPPPRATQPAAQAGPREEALEEVVVTGTTLARTGFETPLSVSQLNEEDLMRLRANSQADILTTVPGLKAEGGGGELATNLQVRAFPSAGAYQFTPLEYNGVPVFSTFGLNSSAFDVYARDDLGVERLEFVTGGVSNLFGPGSVAGIINYIDKTGGETPEGTLQAEFADDGRFRGDFYASGPAGGPDSNTFYALSGFYRYDEGPLDTGLETNGFQLRGNLRREFESGTFTLYGQAIDDRAQFFLPIPLDPVSKERVDGNDGDEVLSLNTNAIDGMRVLLNDGYFNLDHVNDGVATSGGSVYGVLDRDVGNDWRLNVKAKYARYEHRFGIFDPTDGVINVPETQGQFIANRADPLRGGLNTLGTPVFTYAESGTTLPANALVVASRFTDRERPATDFSGEASMTKRFGSGAITNDLTFGTFIARTEVRDITRTIRYLTDFRNTPQLINLTFSNGGVTTGTYALNGYTGALGYTNNKHAALRTAFYIANQMQTDRWAFDVGARVERLDGTLTRENNRAITLDGASYTAQTGAVGPQPNLLTVTNAGGRFLHAEVDTTGWDLSVGTLYRLTDSVNLYANASRGFFFPGLNTVAFAPAGAARPGEPQSFEPEDILIGELGVKFAMSSFSGSVAAFYNEAENRRQVLFINDPGGSGAIIESVNGLGTKGYGIEFNGRYRIAGAFSIDTNFTLQDHEYTEYDVDRNNIGNQLFRKPRMLANAGFTYDNGTFVASVFDNYHGRNFADDTEREIVELDAYHLLRVALGYRIELANARSAMIGLDVFNALDEQGLAEGNPRAFNATTGTEAYFVGRPILPRRYTVRFTVDF